MLAQVKLATTLTAVTVPPGLLPIKVDGIRGRINLEKNVMVAENLHARLGPVALPVLNIRAKDISDHYKITLRAKGPLQVAAAVDGQVEKLLLKHGLQSLAVSADIDMRADFDQRHLQDWTTSGFLVFNNVRAQTHPGDIVLDGLKGRVAFSREKTMNITARDITANIDRAPVRLSGKISGIGSPHLLISGRAYAGKLVLSHLAEFLPVLEEMGLEGMLDMDVDVRIPYSAPAKSRLKGTVTARNVGFQMASSNLAVAKGNLDLTLKGSSANIKSMTLQINDQKLALTGQIANPVEPNIKILVRSPDLNLDRILPPENAAKPLSTASGQDAKKRTSDRKAGNAELPPVARRLTADLQVQADRGQYKGLQFEKLGLNLLYRRGVIENYDVNFSIDKGHISMKGSADLRDLDHIGFAVDPDISALPLETILPVLGVDNFPLNGALILKGQLLGRTGSTGEILASLNGKLDASLGPGNLRKTDKAEDIIVKLSSMAHISSLFSGRLVSDLSTRGIPFETIGVQSSFDKGRLNLSNLHFDSDAITVDGQGTIDLIHQNLNVEALLVPIATVDEALNYVPIVGKAIEDVTKIQIDVEGSLKDPRIRTAEAKEIGKSIETEIAKPKTILKDVGKGLKKIF